MNLGFLDSTENFHDNSRLPFAIYPLSVDTLIGTETLEEGINLPILQIIKLTLRGIK